jgi:hypothetical protein
VSFTREIDRGEARGPGRGALVWEPEVAVAALRTRRARPCGRGKAEEDVGPRWAPLAEREGGRG